jgi:hypothetical protein
MPIPLSYTETGLAQYMKDVLKDTAFAINWLDVPGNYVEAVNDTILAYGVDTIAEATDMQRLRTIARREVWKAVASTSAGNYRFGSDREVYFRNQIYEHALSEYTRAAQEAAKFVTDDDSVRASNMIVVDDHDPYVYTEEMAVAE